eukprot:4006524-Amphidinium_carterae.1
MFGWSGCGIMADYGGQLGPRTATSAGISYKLVDRARTLERRKLYLSRPRAQAPGLVSLGKRVRA